MRLPVYVIKRKKQKKNIFNKDKYISAKENIWKTQEKKQVENQKETKSY